MTRVARILSRCCLIIWSSLCVGSWSGRHAGLPAGIPSSAQTAQHRPAQPMRCTVYRPATLRRHGATHGAAVTRSWCWARCIWSRRDLPFSLVRQGHSGGGLVRATRHHAHGALSCPHIGDGSRDSAPCRTCRWWVRRNRHGACHSRSSTHSMSTPRYTLPLRGALWLPRRIQR